MRTQKDILWKVALHALMPQFVKFFFPFRYDEVDWAKEIHFLDKELQAFQVNSRPANRIADVLVMLHLKDGKQLYVFLHIEIQGYFDENFGFRVHQMCYRIEDKYGSTPAMLSIFTDDDPLFHPKEYRSETWGSGHLTYFNTYKVLENHPSTYSDPEGLVALIMETVYYSTQISKRTDEAIMMFFIPIAKKLFTKGYTKTYIHLVLSFIQAHVKFGNSENYRIFEENLVNMEQFEEVLDLESYFSTEKIREREQAALAAEQVALAAKQAALAAEARERQEKERERQGKERERQEKERERQKKERSILLMINQGISIELITKILDVTVEDIHAIEEKYKDNNPVTNYLKQHPQ